MQRSEKSPPGGQQVQRPWIDGSSVCWRNKGRGGRRGNSTLSGEAGTGKGQVLWSREGPIKSLDFNSKWDGSPREVLSRAVV